MTMCDDVGQTTILDHVDGLVDRAKNGDRNAAKVLDDYLKTAHTMGGFGVPIMDEVFAWLVGALRQDNWATSVVIDRNQNKRDQKVFCRPLKGSGSPIVFPVCEHEHRGDIFVNHSFPVVGGEMRFTYLRLHHPVPGLRFTLESWIEGSNDPPVSGGAIMYH